MTPAACFRDVLARWEGGLSRDPADRGNWCAAADGTARLVGSCHGVSAAALARYRGAPVSAADMAALTLDEAVRIGLALFFVAPGFDRLPWDQLAAALVDFAWGAGPGQAVRTAQAWLGVAVDGRLGPATAAAWRARLARDGLAPAARGWAGERDAFYRRLVAKRPGDARFLAGWLARSASFLPGTAWWGRFAAVSSPAAAPR